MDITKFGLRKDTAYKHWKAYVQACKDNPKDKYLEDMKRVYNQLKSGRKVIDIYHVFNKSGVTDDSKPKLAICQADGTICYCRYSKDGILIFSKNEINSWSWKFKKADVEIRNMPGLPQEILKHPNGFVDYKVILKTMIPKIPASLRPKGKDLNKYYILWEVDKWEIVPPRDPYLLKRLTKNMYVVLAGWDLTDLEQAVMKGRVW